MRTTIFLIGTLALFLGACSSKKNAASPPPLPNKDLVTGKWKNSAEIQFLAGYEFDKDGVLKVTFRGMKEAIPGRYTWSDDRTVDLEYSKTADIEKAYEAAVKAYKEEINDRIKNKKLDGRAGPSLFSLVAGKLPDKDTFKVGITDPKYLVLSRNNGVSQSFEKAD